MILGLLKDLIIFSVVGLILLFVVYPFLRLKYLKRVYGEQVETYFFPFLGFLVLVLEDPKQQDVADQLFTRFLKKNPQMKCLISNFGYHMSYFISDPDTINFVSLNTELTKKEIGGFYSDELYDEALFSTSGEFWKKQRSFVAKMFTHEQNISKLKVIKKHSKNLVEELKNDRFPQDLDEKFSSLIGSVIIESFMGEKFIEIKMDGVKLVDLVRNLISKSLQISNISIPGLLRFSILGSNRKKDIPQFLLTKEEIQYAKKVEKYRELTNQVIQERYEQFEEMEKKGNDDFLQYHLRQMKIEQSNKNNSQDNAFKVTYNQIHHQLMGFAFASTETTTAFCISLCYYLSIYPEIQEKIRKQIKDTINTEDEVTVDNIKNLTLLNAFVLELLRVFPPGTRTLPRKMTKDATLNNWLHTKKKDLVIINILGNHLNEKYFKNPYEFNPDRWLQEQENIQKYYLPFFSGPHNCIGQHFAILEIKAIFVYILNNFRIKLAPEYKLKKVEVFIYELKDKNVAIFEKLN